MQLIATTASVSDRLREAWGSGIVTAPSSTPSGPSSSTNPALLRGRTLTHRHRQSALSPVEHQTFCPYKGVCSYYDIGDARLAAWSYRDAYPEVRRISTLVSFEPDIVGEAAERLTVVVINLLLDSSDHASVRLQRALAVASA